MIAPSFGQSLGYLCRRVGEIGKDMAALKEQEDLSAMYDSGTLLDVYYAWNAWSRQPSMYCLCRRAGEMGKGVAALKAWQDFLAISLWL